MNSASANKRNWKRDSNGIHKSTGLLTNMPNYKTDITQINFFQLIF